MAQNRMPNLKQTRKRMQAVMIGLLVVDAIVIAFLFSPLTSSPEIRKHDLEQAQNDLQLRHKEYEPLMGMDEKLKNAEKQLNTFYNNRLPEKNSAIATELGKLAEQSKIRITQATYENKPSDMPNLTEVDIGANLEGDYTGLVKFINGMERDKMFFIVESVGLSGDQSGGGVRLALRAQTFLKS
jgi:type IV pilus assembly protein PilO